MKQNVDLPRMEPGSDRYMNMVRRVKAEEAGADEELRQRFAGGIRLMLRRALEDERAEQEVQPVLEQVALAIRTTLLRPAELPKLVRRIVRDRILEITGAASFPVDHAAARTQPGNESRSLSESAVLKVLHVEDSASDAALVVRQLETAGYTVHAHRVESQEEMRAALDREAWDVVIADHRLPQFDAPGALRVLKESGRDIPFIVVSGTIGEEAAVKMMKSGAHDYLLKGDLGRLAPAVERELREAQTRSERMEAVQALAEHQGRLALAISAAQLGTFDFFPATGRLVLSELAKRQLGLAADATVDIEGFMGAVSPNDRQRVRQLMQLALRPGGGSYATEYRTTGAEEGNERWLASSGRAFFDSEGRAERFLSVTLDITERRHQQEDLRQLQKLESIARVAGSVAHDFNNLLTLIGGEAQMAADGLSPDSPLQESMQGILKAVTHASALTRQLLTFSRRQTNAPGPILLNELVLETEKLLRRMAGETIELVLSLDEAVPVLRADPVQVQQLLINLVGNAKDASPGGGQVKVTTALSELDEQLAERRGVSPGTYALLSISDNGTGMEPEVLAHVFEPFFTTKKAKGTGLGLATVYGIVRQNHGTIWVESQPGRGSTFTILFPAMEREMDIRPPFQASSA